MDRYLENRYKKINNYKPCKIRIYNKQKEIVFEQPTYVIIDGDIGKVFDIGNNAYRSKDVLKNNQIFGSPFNNGIVADFDLCSNFIKVAFKLAFGLLIFKPKVLISAPIEMTDVEYRALYELLLVCGAKKAKVTTTSFLSIESETLKDFNVFIEIIV